MEKSLKASSSTDSKEAAFLAANIAEAKKGHGTVVLDVREVTLLADYFVITGGDSTAQVRAIAEAIDERLVKLGYQTPAIEGKKEGRWVLLDYGDVIVHILQEKERNFYKLEQFWNQALIVNSSVWAESIQEASSAL